jgi:hypothetical protein
MAFHDFPNLFLRFGDITFPYRRRTWRAIREAHRSRPRRPRPRESLFVANWVGIGSMCPVRIAPALRVGATFRAHSHMPLPRAEAQKR